MIDISTYNEKDDGTGASYETEIHIEGEVDLVIHQLITIFETALLNCQYTDNHT